MLAPLQEAAKEWLRVRTEHPEGFLARSLADVAASMVVASLRRAFRGWRPLSDPSYGVALMLGWQRAVGGAASRIVVAASRRLAPTDSE